MIPNIVAKEEIDIKPPTSDSDDDDDDDICISAYLPGYSHPSRSSAMATGVATLTGCVILVTLEVLIFSLPAVFIHQTRGFVSKDEHLIRPATPTDKKILFSA